MSIESEANNIKFADKSCYVIILSEKDTHRTILKI